MKKKKLQPQQQIKVTLDQTLKIRIATPIAISCIVLAGALGIAGFTGLFSFLAGGNQAQSGPFITNGDFTSGLLSPWASYNSDPAHNGVSVVDEGIGSQGPMLKMVMTQLNPSPARWHLNATQQNDTLSELKPATNYEVHLTAKASVPRSVYFNINSGSTGVGLDQNLDLTTSLTSYTLKFHTPETIPTSGVFFGIAAGDQLGTVWVDDITISEQPKLTYSGAPIQLGTFTADEGWFESNIYYHGTVDTTHVKEGTTARQLSAPANDAIMSRLETSLDLSASNWQISFWLYTDTPTTIGRLEFGFRPNQGGDDNTPVYSFSGLQAGWTKVIITKEQFFHWYWLASIPWASMRSIGLNVEANMNGVATVTIDDLKIEPKGATDVTPPQFLRVTPTNITATSADIMWTTTETVTGSSIACATSTTYPVPVSAIHGTANDYSYSLTSLTQNQLYHCRLEANDAAGNHGYSGDFTFLTRRSTPLVPPDNGQPFPFGMWTTGGVTDVRNSDTTAISNISQTDFSTAHTYASNDCSVSDAALLTYLNVAQAHGKKVMLGMCGTKVLPGTMDLTYVRNRVDVFRNHPALWGWYVFDEPDLTSYDQTVLAQTLHSVYEVIHMEDPTHPVLAGLARPAKYPLYYNDPNKTFDILHGDSYSTPFKPLTTIEPDLIASKASGLPFYYSWQSYSILSQNGLFLTPGYQAARYPSYDEMRTLVMLSTNYGAAGLWTYAYDYINATPGSEWHWTETTRLAQQIQELAPVLNSTIQPSISVSNISDPGLNVGVKVYAGKTYVTIINTSTSSVTGTVTLANAPQATTTELYTGQTKNLTSGTLAVTVPSYGMQMYTLAGSDTTPPPVPTNIVDGASGDVNLTNITDVVNASWNAVTDPSGIDHYDFAIGTSAGATDVLSFTNIGNVTTYRRDGLALTDGQYFIAIRAIDSAGNVGSAGVSNGFTVNGTPPVVSVTSPAPPAFIGGSSVLVSASASDADGVVGVQFAVDGTPIGPEDSSSPYSVNWNSTMVPDGAHTLTAIARDPAGNVATSTGISITVDNTPPPAPATVNDGSGADVQYTKDAATARLNWSAVIDSGSGFSYYQVAVGSTPGGTDIVDYGAHLTLTTVGVGVSTVEGQTYYSSVRAVDKAGNIGSVKTTNGVTVDTQAPAVTMIAPTPNSYIRGSSVAVSATATDNAAMLNVQFRLDGANLGTSDTSAPYSVSWDTTGVSNGTHTLTAIARDVATNATTATSITVTVDNVVPAVSLTAPLNGSFVHGTSQTVSATATDNNGVASVQFQVDGSNIGAEVTSSPFSTIWNTTTSSPGSHVVTAVARDVAGNTTTSTIVSVTVDNILPTGSMTAPDANALVRGPGVMVSATATDNSAVEGVQFTLDGASLLAEDSTSPYSITWDTNTASNGTHLVAANVRDAAGNTTTLNSVSLTVDNLAPSANITAPSNNAFIRGTNVSLTATATDNTSVAGVQFVLDGTNVGSEITMAPYTMSWDSNGASNGAHTLVAVARDTAGNTFTTSTVTITVDNLSPTISLTAPTNGASFPVTLVQLTASASDNIGVAGVQFVVDGVNISPEDTAAPYSVTWDTATAANGNHALSAIARDAAGNSTTSSSVTVTVNNTYPVVVITNPAAGASLTGAAVPVSALASDDVGILGVQFKLDGNDLGAEDTTGPYSIDWNTTPVSNGTHTLTALARDGSDNSTTSEAITVTVDHTSPVVTVTAPIANAFVRGSAVTLSASATDNTAVVGVVFKVDGVTIGSEDTAAPYTLNWNTVTTNAGAHSITAIARDAAGNETTSPTVSVTVDNVPPAVLFSTPTGTPFVKGTTVALTATATDGNGIAGVQFMLDGNPLGAEVTSQPYSVNWNTTLAPEGSHSFSATARDVAGNTTVVFGSAIVDNIAPSASAQVRAGLSGSLPYTNSTSSLSANWDAATDMGSGILRYELAIGTTNGGTQVRGFTSVGNATSSIINGLSLSNGTYYISVRAVDQVLNVGSTVTTSITVDTIAPTVSIISPVGGSIIGGTAIIVVSATDTSGLSAVNYMLDGTIVGSDVFGPYAWFLDTTLLSEGSHTLSVQAQDRAGNSSDSSDVTVVVQNILPCVESWNCGDWTSCSANGTQTRTCVDARACGTILSRPTLQQSCTPPVTPTTPVPPPVTPAIPPASTPAVPNAIGGGLPTISIVQTKGLVTGKSVAITFDSAGATLTQARFTVDGRLVGTDTSKPYAIKWDSRTVRDGKHVIGVQAMAPNGSVSSYSMNATMKNKLEVALSSPKKNGVLKGKVVIMPTIYGGSALKQVKYTLDRTRTITIRPKSPFQITWDVRKIKVGKHTLTITVYDKTKGVATLSVPIVIKR